MKIARFTTGDDPRYGILDETELVVLAGDPLYGGYDTTGERLPLSEVKLLAPVIPRSKVVCVGMNFPEHRADLAYEGPETPLIFLKPNTAIVGPGDPILIPPVEGRIVHEGELAIVIGAVAKSVKAADYEKYVFGYTIANDVTARDVQRKENKFTRAKGFDTFCPLGPALVTADALADPQDLTLTVRVDDEVRQEASTRDMIFPVAALLAFISRVMTLEPGDVVLTGTPEGVGPLEAGQVVRVTVPGIGTLENPVVDEVVQR